jgi:hypothetical protein
MQNRSAKVRGERQLEILAARPSNWRIFNVGRHLSQVRSIPANDSVRLFENRKLDASIVVKHALRPNERDLFERPPVVATKILVPVDPHQMALGAYSFFVGERTAPQTMQRLLGIPLHGHGIQHPDVEILSLLDRTPSLDIFLLKEVLAGARNGVPPSVFDVSLADVPEYRSYIQRELAPLVSIATGSVDLALAGRVVDSIFGARLGPHAESFLTALGLPEHQWVEVVFAWKAALYYEHKAAEIRSRFYALAASLRALQTYGHSESYPRSLVMAQLRSLATIAGGAFGRCQADLALFNSAQRSRIIAARDTVGLGAYLSQLPATVFTYAGNAALVDHILSYWTYATTGFDIARMPAEVFSTLAADLCATAGQYAPVSGPAYA